MQQHTREELKFDDETPDISATVDATMQNNKSRQTTNE